MNKIYNLLFAMISLALFSSSMNGQNLVPNWSFEQYDTCDGGNVCVITNATGWESFSISPDYFNACNTTNGCSVPYNFTYQPAADGNAYAGFYAYESRIYFPSGNTREYIGRNLFTSLQVGKTYFVSIKVNLVYDATGNVECACNKIGVLFTTYTSFVDVPPSPLTKNFAHIYTNSVIKDTANWTTISGSFIADSAYKYIVIGNFFNDANTDTLILGNSNICRAYYFVDEVVVHDTLTGINENILDQGVKVFLQDNILSVEVNIAKDVRAAIYNSIGQCLGNVTIPKFSGHTFNLTTQSKEIYFLKLNTDETEIIKKLIY